MKSLQKLMLCLAVVACSVATVGCGESDEPVQQVSQDAQSPGAINVQLDYQLTRADSSYVLAGTTNLPDGTELIASIEENADSGQLLDVGKVWHSASKQATVKDGKFSAKFSTSSLPPGKYKMLLGTIPWKDMRSTFAKERLGKNGENLFGNNIVDSDSGNGKMLHIEAEVSLD